MDNIIITGIVGMVTAFMGSFTTWLLARRKYNASVDSEEIANLKESLDFYKKIVSDYNIKLDFYIKLAEDNRIEVYRLKGVLHRMLSESCADNSCTKREFYSEDKIREIVNGKNLNENNSNKEI